MFRITWRTPQGRTVLASSRNRDEIRRYAVSAMAANPELHEVRVRQVVVDPRGNPVLADVTHEFTR